MQPRAADRVWDGAPRSIQPSTSGRSSSKYFCMSPDRPECGVLYADHGDGRELARGRRGANVAGDQSWQLSCFHLERTDSTMPRNARIKLRELYKRKLHKHSRCRLCTSYDDRSGGGTRHVASVGRVSSAAAAAAFRPRLGARLSSRRFICLSHTCGSAARPRLGGRGRAWSGASKRRRSGTRRTLRTANQERQCPQSQTQRKRAAPLR